MFFKIRKNDCELIVVTGQTGEGKTSLDCAIAQSIFRNKKFVKSTKKFYENLDGYSSKLKNSVLNQNHYIFSDVDFKLINKKGKVVDKSLDFDPRELRLPADFEKYIYSVYGGVYIIDEFTKIAENRNWQNLPDSIKNLMRYHRHNKLTIIVNLQDITDMDISLLKLFHRVIFINKSYRFYKLIITKRGPKLKVCRTIWKVWEYRGRKGILSAVKYEEPEPFFKRLWRILTFRQNFIVPKTYMFKGCIYDLYPSKSCRPYFYKNMPLNYKYIFEKLKDFVDSKKFYLYYLKSHSWEMGTGYMRLTEKQKEKIREKLKKESTKFV